MEFTQGIRLLGLASVTLSLGDFGGLSVEQKAAKSHHNEAWQRVEAEAKQIWGTRPDSESQSVQRKHKIV